VNAKPGPVTASLYDATGRRVRRWLDRQWMPAGRHQVPFDGRDAQGSRLRSGVYLYQVELPGRLVSGRILFVR
jgi:flagellar hook assembly protein FlgD